MRIKETGVGGDENQQPKPSWFISNEEKGFWDVRELCREIWEWITIQFSLRDVWGQNSQAWPSTCISSMLQGGQHGIQHFLDV